RYQIEITMILVFLLFPLILPDYFQNINIIENFSILIVGIMFVYLFAISILKKELNIFVIGTIIFFLWRSLTSHYLMGVVLDLVNSLRIVTLILLVNIMVRRFPRSTLKALSIIFGIYIVMNCLTLFVFPDGLYLTDKHNKAW